MITFNAKIQRFAKKGEKTGWSYIEISSKQSEKLNPGVKKIYRIRGELDNFEIQKAAIMPMGDGGFILPINGQMRKATGKEAGDTLKVQLELDERTITVSADLMKCLKDDARALGYFKSLPKSHQNYFSKWIDSAKTIQTKTKRITLVVMSLGEGKNFGEMLRANKKQNSF